MTRVIAHLSDLHFGRVDPATVGPIIEAVRALAPDVVAISGDLTQRARRVEFEEARRFLECLPQPRIVVPGNHDLPLHNPYSRFVSKWSAWREYISPDLEPAYVDDTVAVLGVNTARALTWKGGRISHSQIERVRAGFCRVPGAVMKVLVVHHPLDLPEAWAGKDSALRARRAFASWADCGVDMILAGHHHAAFASGSQDVLRFGAHGAIVVQAGTATSTRVRGEPNSFNSIEVRDRLVTVSRHTWDPGAKKFQLTHEHEFART